LPQESGGCESFRQTEKIMAEGDFYSSALRSMCCMA
jgi:hypothetical protein